MDSSDINVFAYLINASIVFLVLLAVMGLMQKLSSIFMAVLAYPVYLALYTFEIPASRKDLSQRRVLSLNLPSSNPKRTAMNFLASLVVFCSLPNLITLYSLFNAEIQYQSTLLLKLFLSDNSFQLWSNSFALLFIAGIYWISYKSEIDPRPAFEKIEGLSIPSLWKDALKV